MDEPAILHRFHSRLSAVPPRIAQPARRDHVLCGIAPTIASRDEMLGSASRGQPRFGPGHHAIAVPAPSVLLEECDFAKHRDLGHGTSKI
jgi:hypothetical protein